MSWSEQTEQFQRIMTQKLSESGKKYTQAAAAEFLGIPVHLYRAWLKGQCPVSEDLQMLAREHEFRPDWLLLGVGEPLQQRKEGAADPECVEICDTLRELVRGLPDTVPQVAAAGGMTTTDLYDCIHAHALPPTAAVAKWIHKYRINANFLLAQVGEPFLKDGEYMASGPLDDLRRARGDFDESEQETVEESAEIRHLQEKIARLQDQLIEAQERLIEQQRVTIQQAEELARLREYDKSREALAE